MSEGRDTGGSEADAAIRDHLANERPMLAWQRTALGVAGIGFLFDRFALGDAAPTLLGSLLGFALVLGGAVLSVVGVTRFRRTELDIDTRTCRPAPFAHLALTAAIVVGAVVLAAYPILTPR